MKQARLERKRIINASFDIHGGVEPGDEGMTPEMMMKKQQEQTSTLVQLEMARIEKMQKRQEKELEQMIQYEINRAKVQEDMTQRLEQNRRKEEDRKRQADKRARLAAEEKRLKDMQRAAMDEMEEENRRQIARQMHDREKEIEDKRQQDMMNYKRRLADEQRERDEKATEHKRTVQKYFADEQLKLRERLESMNFHEAKKQAAMMERQQVHAEEVRIRREKIEKRLAMNMMMAEKIEEKRKQDFLDKQESFEKARNDHLARQEQERLLNSQEIMLQEQRRHMIMLQQRREEELEAERLLRKFDEEEEQVIAAQKLRDKEHALLNEKKSLRVQMKLENVDRVMRQGEYKKSSTLRKIEDTDSRIQGMMQMKHTLVIERRRQAAKTRVLKEKVASVMEGVRTDATKASKVIALAMSGKIPLKDIATGKALELRSTSATALKKKKPKRDKSHAEMMGLTGDDPRTSKSAGAASAGGGGYGFDEFNDEADGPADGARGVFTTEAPAEDPLPYVSPYTAQT
jgi:hypothetical protein